MRILVGLILVVSLYWPLLGYGQESPPTQDVKGEISLNIKGIGNLRPTFNLYGRNYQIHRELDPLSSFRLIVHNPNNQYVYVLWGDKKTPTSLVGEIELVYSSIPMDSVTNFIIPNGTDYLEIDTEVSSDCIAILFSPNILDIDSILDKAKDRSKSFGDRIDNALYSQLVAPQDVKYILNDVGFSSIDSEKVIPVYIEFVH